MSEEEDTQKVRRSKRRVKPPVRYSEEDQDTNKKGKKRSRSNDEHSKSKSGEESSGGENSGENPPKKKQQKKSSKAKEKKPRPKAPPQKTLSKEVVDQLSEDQKKELLGLKVNELRERLGNNKQLKSGVKEELQNRIADCIINGALPPCPKCEKTVRQAADPEIGYFCSVGFRGKCDWQSKTVDRIPWVNKEGSLV